MRGLVLVTEDTGVRKIGAVLASWNLQSIERDRQAVHH